MVLGLYDDLISSVNGIFDKKRRRESIKFLLWFLLGAAVGFVLFAKLITFLLGNDACAVATRYFFLGAVAGGAPLIFRATSLRRISLPAVLYTVLGIAMALLIGLIPEGLFELSGEGAGALIKSIVIQLFGGLVVAIALVLPGISCSQMLCVIGVYEPFTKAVSELDFGKLLTFLPLAVGTVLGIFLTTGILERAMKKAPMQTYLIIFGFVLGSLPELFPGLPAGWDLLFAPLALAAGFLLVYFISGREKAN